MLLKYKRGALEVQRGGGGGLAAFGVGKRKAVGSNIDMKTNVESLEQAAVRPATHSPPTKESSNRSNRC